MAKKIDAKVYRAMSAKELFVVFEAASAREDFAEADWILAAAPKHNFFGIDREVARLSLKAVHLGNLVLFHLQTAFDGYRAFKLAADLLCVDRGIILVGTPEDEEAIAQAMERVEGRGAEDLARDLMIAQVRDAQSEQAQEVSAILEAIGTLCDEEVGLTPEQLIGSTAPFGIATLEAAVAIHDLDPEPKLVDAYLDVYRMMWRAAEGPREL